MYLRAAKTEAEESGESTEGMADSVSELRSEILALTGNRVDIQLTKDQFKSTYQIAKELSEVWHDLSDITQANILERIGGKRNGSVIASLLTNFQDTEKALKTSQNASGSALAENEKYLNSIQGKLDVLKATGQSISIDLLDSDAVKMVLDFANAIGKLTDNVIKFAGVIPTIAGAGGIAAFFKNLD